MLLYHYCDIATFINILSSKVLWLCNLTHSTDREEVIRTFNNLWDTVKQRLFECDLDKKIVNRQIEILDKQYEIEMQTDSPFGCCFCLNPNSSQQWEKHGDNSKGIVLGFDFDWFTKYGLVLQIPHPNANIESAIGFWHAYYHDFRTEDSIYKICYDSILEYGNNAWLYEIRPTFKHYSAFIKNPIYGFEEEVRIVYYPDDDHDYTNNFLNISKFEQEPKEHYCLPWVRNSNDASLTQIGLGCNCILSFNEIKTLLNNAGLKINVGIFSDNEIIN